MIREFTWLEMAQATYGKGFPAGALC
ncbi:protein of unknown function [Pseudomonas mediterranea]